MNWKGGNILIFPSLLEKEISVFQKQLSSWCIYMPAKQRLHIWNEFCIQFVCLYGINFKWSWMVMPFQCYIYSLRLPGEPWHPSWNLSLQHSLFITVLFSNRMIYKLNALSSITCGSHVIHIDYICCPVDKCGSDVSSQSWTSVLLFGKGRCQPSICRKMTGKNWLVHRSGIALGKWHDRLQD